MAVRITETFGFRVSDQSPAALAQRESQICPFTGLKCWKSFRSGGLTNGVCVLKPSEAPEVVVCPDRMYGESFKVLKDVAEQAFGAGISLIKPSDLSQTQGQPGRVVAFGKRAGKELGSRRPLAEHRRLMEEMSLHQLRKARELTQTKIAEELHMGQGDVSKTERRTDMYVSTLASYLQAVGADLEIRAVFPDGRAVKITRFSE
ncbi:MAG TPA: hypothetical protein VKG25_05530 [Bryobacteraceae bacterium]|nr:hypothetical protein [Bryobacteraceae bacterium]